MSGTRWTKVGKVAAKVFRIRYKACPNAPHPGCTAASYHVSSIGLCHTAFTRITGLKFTGTKWFILVEVETPRKRG